MNDQPKTLPSVSEASSRIDDASADLDALHGHLLHIASLAEPPGGEGDPDLAQTCYTLANSVKAIRVKVDDANRDLRAIELGRQP